MNDPRHTRILLVFNHDACPPAGGLRHPNPRCGPLARIQDRPPLFQSQCTGDEAERSPSRQLVFRRQPTDCKIDGQWAHIPGLGREIWVCIPDSHCLWRASDRTVRSQSRQPLLQHGEVHLRQVKAGTGGDLESGMAIWFQIQFLVDSSCQFGRGLLWAEGESHKR